MSIMLSKLSKIFGVQEIRQLEHHCCIVIYLSRETFTKTEIGFSSNGTKHWRRSESQIRLWTRFHTARKKLSPTMAPIHFLRRPPRGSCLPTSHFVTPAHSRFHRSPCLRRRNSRCR